MSESVGSGKALLKILAALFKNKLRFGDNASKSKRVGTLVIFGLAYALILAFSISMSVLLGITLRESNEARMAFYFMALFTGSLVVLVFGVIHLISTLFLSKDTDFYSTLPVKSWVVFAAKLLYVYISETAIVIAVLLPALMVYGGVVGAWAGYYIITLLTLFIVPAFPLGVAAIISIPVMFIAGKLKNRGIIAIVFYVLMFATMFGIYFYFMFTLLSMQETISDEQIISLLNFIKVVEYILYPYVALTSAAFGIPSFGYSAGVSVAINLFIFLVISIGLFAILLILARFMYSMSTKANNQTNNSRAKQGEFKTGGALKALIKREYAISLRTTQTTFQCFVVFLLPILFSVIFGIMMNKLAPIVAQNTGMFANPTLFSCTVISVMLASTANASFTAFSREGESVESLKTLPLTPKKIVGAKVLAWLTFAFPSAVISAIILNAFAFEPLNFTMSVIGFPLLATVFVIFGTLWDMKSPKLKWTDPSQAIKHNSHATIGMLLCMVCGIVLMILYMNLFDNLGLDKNALFAVVWGVIFAEILTFGIVDVILYKKLDIYYARMRV